MTTKTRLTPEIINQLVDERFPNPSDYQVRSYYRRKLEQQMEKQFYWWQIPAFMLALALACGTAFTMQAGMDAVGIETRVTGDVQGHRFYW